MANAAGAQTIYVPAKFAGIVENGDAEVIHDELIPFLEQFCVFKPSGKSYLQDHAKLEALMKRWNLL